MKILKNSLKELVFTLLLGISRLPSWLLYFFSDLLFLVNRYLFHYRYKEVKRNLEASFPEKNASEIIHIQKRFFQNFCDYIVEMIWSFTMSETEAKVRVQHLNRKVFKEIQLEGKDAILLAGHIFNWEWISALSTLIPQKNTHPVYRKMQDDFWEEKLKKIRNRYRNEAVEANQILRHILSKKTQGDSVYMFLADQSPNHLDIHLGINFLNQKTPVYTGYDRLATRMNLAFVYCEMKKVKRGYYQVKYHRIFPDGEKFKEFEVVQKFHNLLEKTIRENPDNWLWSHRRWKYQDLIKHMI